MTKEQIEKIFRSSNSSEELFDAFDDAIVQKLEDEELYKVFLANSVLSNDEIKFYAKKISDVFPAFSYSIALWCCELFANKEWSPENTRAAVECLEVAIEEKPEEHIPLIRLLSLYNHDMSVPTNSKIIGKVKKALPKVKNKSAVYKAIAEFYAKEGKDKLKRKYEGMAHKYK